MWYTDETTISLEQLIDGLREALDESVLEQCGMIGQILLLACDPPSYCLICDGSEYWREDYPELMAVLSSNYYTDELHFRVPALIGRFPLGDYSPAYQAGEENHQLTTDEMPAHSHTFSAYVVPAPGVAAVDPGVEPSVAGALTGGAGGGLPHNNMPPYETVIPVIVARFPDA